MEGPGVVFVRAECVSEVSSGVRVSVSMGLLKVLGSSSVKRKREKSKSARVREVLGISEKVCWPKKSGASLRLLSLSPGAGAWSGVGFERLSHTHDAPAVKARQCS